MGSDAMTVAARCYPGTVVMSRRDSAYADHTGGHSSPLGKGCKSATRRK